MPQLLITSRSAHTQSLERGTHSASFLWCLILAWASLTANQCWSWVPWSAAVSVGIPVVPRHRVLETPLLSLAHSLQLGLMAEQAFSTGRSHMKHTDRTFVFLLWKPTNRTGLECRRRRQLLLRWYQDTQGNGLVWKYFVSHWITLLCFVGLFFLLIA